MQDGRGRCGHCHRYQPAGVLCALPAFSDAVEDDYRVTAKEVRVHKKMAVRIIKVGLPTGIQNMVISLSNVLVQVSVNGYGAAAMAALPPI